MLFVTTLDVEANVERVSMRVRKGGHQVPEADIRRRFVRAHANFWELYRPLSNNGWDVYASLTGERRIHLAYGWEHGYEIINEELFEQFQNICYRVE